MRYRRPNPRLAKIHRSYSVDEVSCLLDIHTNMIGPIDLDAEAEPADEIR